jgi:hypothetical protein
MAAAAGGATGGEKQPSREPVFQQFYEKLDNGVYRNRAEADRDIGYLQTQYSRFEAMPAENEAKVSRKRALLQGIAELIPQIAGMANAPSAPALSTAAAAGGGGDRTETPPAPAAAPALAPAPPSHCPTLYDPCTREPLADFRTLEKRVNTLRRELDTTPVGLYGLTNETTNYDFLLSVFLNKEISLDDMVNFKLGSGGTTGADIFEVLCRLFVYFGGLEGVDPRLGGNYQFMQKIEASVPAIYADPRDAFRQMKCKATSAAGISDITLVRTAAAGGAPRMDSPYCESECKQAEGAATQTYLMSVKWYKKEKSAEHYDLEKLYAAANHITSAEQKPLDIIVFLKSKRDFEIAHQRAYRQYVKHLSKTFFGWNEDVRPKLQDVRRQIFERAALMNTTPQIVLEQEYFTPGAKPGLSLQLHQEIIVQSVCDAFAGGDDNRYLVGVLPRGGKTYIAGGIIREYLRRAEARTMNVLWLTAAPTETRSQVGADLIEKFQDFAEFEFIDVKNTTVLTKKKRFSFFFCSTQLITQAAAAADKKKRVYLNDLLNAADQLGLIFYDEAHKTATGDKTREEVDTILKAYEALRLPFIFLTATYYNIMFDYRILMENTFIWDYTDVLKSRGLATLSEQEEALANLKKRFNPAVVTAIVERRVQNGESLVSMGTAYINFPDLYFLSVDFQEEALARFAAQEAFRPDSGFNMKSIFAVRPDAKIAEIRNADGTIRADAYRAFANQENPRNMVALLTPSADPNPFGAGEAGGEPFAKAAGAESMEPSILGRINALSRTAESRFRLDEMPTLMMFMPTGGQGSRIFYTLAAWAALLLAHPWWRKRYEVACVVDQGSLSAEELAEIAGVEATAAAGIHIIGRDPKAQILQLERRLHCPEAGVDSKGLVVLAGQKLSMGVSLPCTDVVMLFNDSKSPDDIIQKMYRALTPSTGKRAAFVVDLNPVRSLAAVYGYTRASNTEANTAAAVLDIIYDTYSWDSDFFDSQMSKGEAARPQQFQDKLRELFAEAEKDPAYRIHEDFGGIERKVGENIRRFVDTRLMTVLTDALSEKRVAGGGGGALEIALKDGSTASLRGGQLVIKGPMPPAAEGNAEGAPAAEEIIIENFIEAVKDFVKYLAITTTRSDLLEALNEYEADAAFQSNINQLMIARGAVLRVDKKIAEVLITTVRNLYRESRGLQMMFRDTKGKIDEPSARKNAVLKIIHQRLTPRQKQKAEVGEVFTPIELVESMLEHLPAAVWSNPDLKWFDPANGIGNFPVVAFYKLDKGLATRIPDEAARRKHIVSNMLYMVEYQSSNSRVARNIFRKLCNDTCEPNIWTLDATSLTSAKLKAHGWPEQFDVIMGNPPYNAGGLGKGGGTLWPKFVRLAFDLVKRNGFIVYIHPPGWRKFYDPSDRDNQGKIWYDIKEKGWHLAYLNVSDTPPKHFPLVDYYVIHAAESAEPTEYDSRFLGVVSHGNLKLSLPFIPNMINSHTMSIIHKLMATKGLALNIVYDQSFKPTAADMGKKGTPHFHFITRTGEQRIVGKTYAGEVPTYISKPKVIMTFKGGYDKGRLFAFYTEDNIGTTNNSMYMLVDSKQRGEKIAKFLNTNPITFLMKITQYSASPNHINEFKILNQLEMPGSMADYNFTEEEIALMEKINGQQHGGKRMTRKKPRQRPA